MVKECQTSIIEKNWRSQNLWEKQISRKENLKKCTNFEEQKGTRHIRENFCFGAIFFSCPSSTKSCLRFLLICFDREIKGIYQSSLRNEVDYTDIMNVFPNILTKNWNFIKLRQDFVDKRAMIKTTLTFSCHRKTLVPFYLRKKIPENAFLTLTVNYPTFLLKKITICLKFCERTLTRSARRGDEKRKRWWLKVRILVTYTVYADICICKCLNS